jgi:quercetin dioxygenase-like cupin family protein
MRHESFVELQPLEAKELADRWGIGGYRDTWTAARDEVTSMRDFPLFVKNPANRIEAASQFTDDVEGYLFDGADGSQLALWTAHAERASREHAHDFDEYVFVLKGRCTLILGEQRIELRAGDEFIIPRGIRQSMEVDAGTRTMHVFGGKRARRVGG